MRSQKFFLPFHITQVSEHTSLISVTESRIAGSKLLRKQKQREPRKKQHVKKVLLGSMTDYLVAIAPPVEPKNVMLKSANAVMK
jgi:hypothetical protein